MRDQAPVLRIALRCEERFRHRISKVTWIEKGPVDPGLNYAIIDRIAKAKRLGCRMCRVIPSSDETQTRGGAQLSIPKQIWHDTLSGRSEGHSLLAVCGGGSPRNFVVDEFL